MNRQFMVLALLLIAGWVPQSARAQSDGCSQFSIPIVLRDVRGELIHGYSPNDLEAKVNGKTLNIDSTRPEGRPRRIVILLDASGSMRGTEKEVPWGEAIRFAELLTSRSEGRAQLALLIFNAKVIEEIGFADDNSAVTKRLGELKKDKRFFDHSVQGSTALNDAIGRALELLGQSTSADALYIASDGADTHSRLKRRELQQRLSASGVRVFFTLLHIPLEQRSASPEEENAGPDSSELAQRTGGGIMYISPIWVELGFETHPKPILSEKFRMFFEGMFENEILQVSVANQDLKKRDLRIALSASAPNHLKGAQLFYPRQLCVCATTQGVGGTR